VHLSTRRHILSAGSALLGGSHLTIVAQAATAVYHEVSVSLPSADESSDDFPEHEDPPTYVTATGRIVASELTYNGFEVAVRSAGTWLWPLPSLLVCCLWAFGQTLHCPSSWMA
jgi:hypothetical protein